MKSSYSFIIALILLPLIFCSCNDSNSGSHNDASVSSDIFSSDDIVSAGSDVSNGSASHKETYVRDPEKYSSLPKEGTEEYETEQNRCVRTMYRINELDRDEYNIVDVEDNDIWISITVAEEKDIRNLENKLYDTHFKLTTEYCWIYIHPPLKEVSSVPTPDGSPVTDIYTIEELVREYTYELGLLGMIKEKDGTLNITVWKDIFVEPMTEYLKDCNVDMSLVSITPTELRVNT
ncbi:MAG: hypothetical protein IJ571_09510 [Ruminococcus sp.]|nr:hypothetical protein [Ruminococcus sp.]